MLNYDSPPEPAEKAISCRTKVNNRPLYQKIFFYFLMNLRLEMIKFH
jgi:hypothetical protein